MQGIAADGTMLRRRETLIPAHPKCRCVFIPYAIGDGVGNPHHDPKSGQFSSGGVELSEADLSALEPRWNDVKDAKERKNLQTAVYDWMGSEYSDINDALRKGDASDWISVKLANGVVVMHRTFDFVGLKRRKMAGVSRCRWRPYGMSVTSFRSWLASTTDFKGQIDVR